MQINLPAPVGPGNLPYAAARHYFVLMLVVVTAGWSAPGALAHDTTGHASVLNAGTVGRVVDSLDTLFDALERTGRLGLVRLPSGAVNLAALLGPLEQTVADTDGTSVGDSPTLRQALRGAGYAESPLMIDEWRYETRELLLTYEQLETLPRETVHDAEHIEPVVPQLKALLARVGQ